MAVSPTGMIAKPLDYLRKTVAGSAAFRTWVGADDAAAALPWIHVISLDLAQAEPTITDGVISAITVTDAGGSYPATPTVTITGDGSAATATATVAGGIVTAIAVDEGGSGYTSAEVTLSIPMPFAVVDWDPNWARVAESGGSRAYFVQEGDLILWFRAAVSGSHNTADAAYTFINTVGTILAEMEALAGLAGYLGITRISVIESFRRPMEDERKVLGDFYEVIYRISYEGE